MIRVFATNLIRQQITDIELKQLKTDFQRYKETDSPADNFGRDALYDDSNNLPSVRLVELRHLHLLNQSENFLRYARQYDKTSDDHLVYCQGFYSDRAYLLIALLSPNAHKQARNNDAMLKLAGMAENFRNQH